MAADVLGGRYRLERQLSATQMAEVWLAHDDVLERSVVVKLLAAYADRQRFEREARAVALLSHPNIVQLFDFGEHRGRPYMVLEHVPAGTLAGRLPDGVRLPDDSTRRIATDIASALAYAHANGVVHRDLKPANVLFDDEGRAKIADFGIASVRGMDTLTEAGTVMGTAAYMSPEQVVGEPATAASDVYSFGILLFRMLTGRLPFEAEQPLELAAMQRDTPAPLVRSLRRDAPADLATLATAALAKDRLARPADGAAVLAALEGAQLPEAGSAEAATMPLRVPAPRRRRPWPLIAAIAAVLAALGVGLAVLLVHGNGSTPAATTTHRPTSAHGATTPTTSTTTSTRATTTASTTTTTTSPTRPPTTAPPPTRPTTATTAPATSAPTTTAPTVSTVPPGGTTTGP